MEAVTEPIRTPQHPVFPAAAFHFPEAPETEDDAEIIYPESDGEPMGETGFHVRASLDLYGSLREFFSQRKDVYVAADMFFYYEKGNPKACKAPDVMVIFGCGNQERRTYKLWEEKICPSVIFEVTSKSSMMDDMVVKPMLYASLGVREYFLFDPLDEYMEIPLAGFRLYERDDNRILPDEEGRLYSKELDVFLKRENEYIRVIDAKTGKAVPSLHEALSIAQQEAQRAEQESQRAEQEAQKALQERERAQRLSARLRELGIDPEHV
ncbi:MAG: Uma2 family endonuclease [Desulfobacterales bacterium]